MLPPISMLVHCRAPPPTVAGKIAGLTIKTTVLAGLVYGSFLLSRGSYRLFNRVVISRLK